MELFATQAAEPTGIGILTVFEELFWGDAGIALSILGTGLAAASLAAIGTPEQVGEWLPQMFGTPEDPLLASFLFIGTRCGLRCGRHPDSRSLRRSQRRVVTQRCEDLGHQRRNRQRAHRRCVGPSRTRQSRASHVHHPAEYTRGSNRDRSSRNTASALHTPLR